MTSGSAGCSPPAAAAARRCSASCLQPHPRRPWICRHKLSKDDEHQGAHGSGDEDLHDGCRYLFVDASLPNP